MPTAPPLVSIVFSFRNEAAVLPELIERVTGALAPLPVRSELVFVDDASDDGSRELLTARAAADPRIKLVTMSRRFGVVECALAGLRYARGDAAVLMDADLQDPPELLPTVIERWRAGADVVHTVRTARHGESAFKMAATRLAYRVLGRAANIPLVTDAGDFKLFSRRALDALLALPEYDPYLRGLAAWIGFTQAYVPYERQARFAGRSHFPFFSRNPWRTFLSGLTSFSMAPLVLLLPAGAVLALAGLALGAGLLLAGPAPAWDWIVALLLVLSGVQLAGLGVVGLYLARVYADVRGRPRYIVAETVGFDAPRADADAAGAP